MSGYDRPAVAVAIEVNHMLFSHYILIALGATVASLSVYRSFIPFRAVYSALDMPQQPESTVFQNARPGVRLDHLALPNNFHHPNHPPPLPRRPLQRHANSPLPQQPPCSSPPASASSTTCPSSATFSPATPRHAPSSRSGSSARPKHYEWIRPAPLLYNDHALSLSPCRG